MIENISKEEAKHMVELLKKKSILVKNFSDKLEKYRISGDRETYNKKFKECSPHFSCCFVFFAKDKFPQTGLLAFVSAEIIPKLAGSAAILVTHQLVKS